MGWDGYEKLKNLSIQYVEIRDEVSVSQYEIMMNDNNVIVRIIKEKYINI